MSRTYQLENLRLFHRIIKGQDLIQRIAIALVDRSCYFSIEPLPDDEWEVQAKAGEGIEAIVDRIAATPMHQRRPWGDPASQS